MNRLIPLDPETLDAVLRELTDLENRVIVVGNTLGRAAWCDKALRIHRLIGRLKGQVGEFANRRASITHMDGWDVVEFDGVEGAGSAE